MRETPRTDRIIHFLHSAYVGREPQYCVCIGKFEDGTLLGYPFANRLPEEIARFLADHGACAECGGRVSITLDACACGGRPMEGGHLKIVIMSRAGTPSFDDLLDREGSRSKSARRGERIKKAETTLTEEDVRLLLSLQQSLCFYCGEEFAVNESGPIFHRDHFNALVSGGATTLQNTVLACPACNTSKGRTDGESFLRSSQRVRRVEVKARYSAMRRKFRLGMKAHLRDCGTARSPQLRKAKS